MTASAAAMPRTTVSRYHLSVRVERGLQPLDCFAPTDEVAVGHDHARNIHREIAVAELVEVKQVGANFANQAGEEIRRVVQILRSLVHPLQAESCGTIFQAMEQVHPRRLLGQGNLAEADQRDPYAARDEAGDQFTGVAPGTGHGVGGDQYVHGTSGCVGLPAGCGLERGRVYILVPTGVKRRRFSAAEPTVQNLA